MQERFPKKKSTPLPKMIRLPEKAATGIGALIPRETRARDVAAFDARCIKMRAEALAFRATIRVSHETPSRAARLSDEVALA